MDISDGGTVNVAVQIKKRPRGCIFEVKLSPTHSHITNNCFEVDFNSLRASGKL